MVTILMVFVSGAENILKVALRSLARHDPGTPYHLSIITDVKDEAATRFVEDLEDGNEVIRLDVGMPRTGSGQHGMLLDQAMEMVDSEYVLTLDSDCFPVADGWLKAMVDMQEDDVAASGILWPWIPVPETVDHKTIEWRIRSHHCWNNTQPACQLIRTKLMRDRGWKFADMDGDDTNHGFCIKAHAAGMRMVGWKPTRGPLPDDDFDPEVNRHESLIFGDMMYHHVGATRESRGLNPGQVAFFSKARQRVYNENGAEWMLKSGNSHIFRMDQEERVAQIKMDMLYRTARAFLETHQSLFCKDWA